MIVRYRMLRSYGFALGVGLLLLGLVPLRAEAYDPTARFSLAGQLGLATASMGDVNDEIARGNRYLRSRNWLLVDEVNSVFGFVYDLRADLTSTLLLSLGGGRSFGSVGVDFDQVLDIKPSANFLQARLLYRLPWRPTESVRLALGGGVVNATSAELEVSHEHRSVEAGTQRLETLTIDASGWGALGVLEAELVLNETFTLVGDLGYRYLKLGQDGHSWSISKVDNPAVDANQNDVPDGRELAVDSYLRRIFLDPEMEEDEIDVDGYRVNDVDLDFSGVQANVGLRVYLF